MVKSYFPDKGDIVWLDFDPQTGNEIKKTRPALVLSPKEYNTKSRFALFVPATSTIRNSPWEVRCSIQLKDSVFLVDQIHSFDWRKRNAKYIGRAHSPVVKEVIEKFLTLIGVG